MPVMRTWVVIPVLALVFVALFLLERLFPLRNRTAALLQRLALNLVLSALSFLTAAAVVRPAGGWVLRWSAEQSFGLLHWLRLPAPLAFAFGFLLMDLSFYYWHLANHKIPFLWRFHNVHHIDADLDVSTAFRFHFGEVAFSAGFRVVQILLLGVSVWTYAIYEMAFQANTMFHHSNWRLPIRVERVLNAVLVTPRMHGIHHSKVERETNSNFSTIFSWWDRLHRSLDVSVPQAELVIGVPAYTRREDAKLSASILLPFQRQRDYWHKPDGTPVQRAAPRLNGPPGLMAE
jgi:sterol desaturase/sphingolipid hydroxylase (fatty acid hydroxylase superfamily)